MEKWLGLVFITLIFMIGVNTAIEKQLETDKARFGLEECRVDANTIWVKDCKTILETKARLKW